jgi:cytochrome c peroxidase
MIRTRWLSRSIVAATPLLLLVSCMDAPTAVDPQEVEIHEGAAVLAMRGGLPFSEEMAELGDLIFDDRNLSRNRNQACNSCHSAEWGFTGPDSRTNAAGAVYEGSVRGAFGDRKPPSSAYATLSPVFSYSRKHGAFVGGNFWDGRATGERLGSPAAEQAQGPFLNPKEHALPDAACVVYRVSRASYVDLYTRLWGSNILRIGFPADTDALCEQPMATVRLSATDRKRVQTEYDNIAIAIAVYEESHNLFSSKFDAVRRGLASFTAQERRGLELFEGRAMCAACHTSHGHRPAFTDFTYDNLGVPKNPENPIYRENRSYVDLGLGGFLATRREWRSLASAERGKMKVPTLRNVDLRPSPGAVKAYMHNGVFKSLEEVVHFYNTRDVLPACRDDAPRAQWGKSCWPAPEVRENVNREELGNLGLTAAEEEAIVAFLRTLSDGYIPSTRGRHLRGMR